MARHVALRLLDPEALVRIAEQIKKLFTGRYPEKRAPIRMTMKGELTLERISRAEGGTIGVVTHRAKSKQVAFHGVLLQDFEDELIEAFRHVGLSAVVVRKPDKK